LTNRRRGLLFLAVIACAGPAAAQERPPLKWGADADGGIPYVFADADGTPAGFEVDLAAALAKELGRKIDFEQRAFDSLIPLVGRGDIDFAMNGVEITPERQQTLRFTRPYYVYHLQLVTRQGEDRFTTLEQCKEQGRIVATLGATAAERLLDDMGVAKRIYEEQEGPYRDLLLGRGVDAVLMDLPIAIYYAATDPTLKHGRRIAGLKFAGRPVADGYYGIAVAKDNTALAEELDAALGRVIASGELKRILMQWELWNHDQYRLYSPEGTEIGEPERMSIEVYLPLLAEGAWMTVRITLAGMLVAVLVGLPIAVARLYGPPPVQWLATAYVEFFRGIPVLLLLYFLYYGLASLVPSLAMGPMTAAILGFGLNYAAYEAEIYRAGIAAIPAGQWEAAASLGMPGPLTFRRIILPQAIRTILPPTTNDLVALFKDTSVVSIIGVVELSKQYQILTKSYGGFLQIGLATAILYLVMSVPLGYLSRRLEQKWARGM
jgi:polar amino acid transport system substrate-binding protein